MQAFFASFANAETVCFRVKRLRIAAACVSGSILALSVKSCGFASSPKVGALGSPHKLHLFAKASPFGRGGSERSELTERTSPLKLFAAAVPLYDPSHEKVAQKRPQAFLSNKS